MAPPPPPPAALLLLLALAVARAQHPASSPSIYRGSGRYAYHGCYNETTETEGSARVRALADGIVDVRPGQMTVPICLAFCANGAHQYRYAGLEWSRECWCSQTLAGIAQKLDDERCDLPCDGDGVTACGGSLKLSVYRLSGRSVKLAAPALGAASLALALALALLVS